MKKFTIAIFAARSDAEKAISDLHTKLDISNKDISYIYKNTEGEVKEFPANEISGITPGEGAKTGAEIGVSIGVLAGIAAVVGVIPVVGPILAAGPLVAALGLGTGALATAAAGALSGAAAGGIVGALVSLGMGEEHAKKYQDQVLSGNILVAVHADDSADVEGIFTAHQAMDITTHSLA